MEKLCKACGEYKLFITFNKSPTTKDGYKGKCKLCLATARREKKQTNENID